MNLKLNEITQISLYLKEEAEKINEIAIFQPLLKKSEAERELKLPVQRKWSYLNFLPLHSRLSTQFQAFLFKHLPLLVPLQRRTIEAKFKTVLAILLSQEELRQFFLGNRKKREHFFAVLDEVAHVVGYHSFSSSKVGQEESPYIIGQQLTKIEGKKSLIEDPAELNLQIAALDNQERGEILFHILNRATRLPITSVIEVLKSNSLQSVTLTTQFAKYKITQCDVKNREIHYFYAQNQATSSIQTDHNSLPNAKGTINQREVLDCETQKRIGMYCGELSTKFHVLEQILFILGEKEREIFFSEHQEGEETPVHNIKILFTSLYSWNELPLISDQREAIHYWDQKFLKSGTGYYHLDLKYLNISFNVLNKFPTPAEIKARLSDINTESLILLIAEGCSRLKIEYPPLEACAAAITHLRNWDERRFLEREKKLLNEIDHFKEMEREIASQLTSLPQTAFSTALLGLLSNKRVDGKLLKGMDHLLYLNTVATHLGYHHNKNCHNALDRSAGADAADKALYAYQKIYQKNFLPGGESFEEQALFKILYSLYLVWEEPEMNTALSSGFLGEKFYKNFIQKNPETTRYLMDWLKKHPEVYLGLSHFR